MNDANMERPIYINSIIIQRMKTNKISNTDPFGYAFNCKVSATSSLPQKGVVIEYEFKHFLSRKF